jgi:hypothetical protein
VDVNGGHLDDSVFSLQINKKTKAKMEALKELLDEVAETFAAAPKLKNLRVIFTPHAMDVSNNETLNKEITETTEETFNLILNSPFNCLLWCWKTSLVFRMSDDDYERYEIVFFKRGTTIGRGPKEIDEKLSGLWTILDSVIKSVNAQWWGQVSAQQSTFRPFFVTLISVPGKHFESAFDYDLNIEKVEFIKYNTDLIRSVTGVVSWARANDAANDLQTNWLLLASELHRVYGWAVIPYVLQPKDEEKGSVFVLKLCILG